jgi:hypothetical protein
MNTYPDIQLLLDAKAAWRKKQAALPFEEKIKIVAKLSGWNIETDSNQQENLEPLPCTSSEANT